MLTCTAFRASVTLEVSLSDSQKKKNALSKVNIRYATMMWIIHDNTVGAKVSAPLIKLYLYLPDVAKFNDWI